MTRAPVLEVGARTDPGLRRSANEDSFIAADPCFLVADGMGGHDAGDLASRAAIAAFAEAFTRPGAATIPEIETALDRARAAVAEISAAARRGAGCTLTGAIRTEHEGAPYWYVLNIGDSRVYLQRDAGLTQLTRDHSLQSELSGDTDPQRADTPSNIITRALGSDDDRHDAWLLPVEAGTRLLVCSDGLTADLPDADLLAVLAGADPDGGADRRGVGETGGSAPRPRGAGHTQGGTGSGSTQEAAESLVELALAAGGRDNITAVVIDVVDAGGDDTSGSDTRAVDSGAVDPGAVEPDGAENVDAGEGFADHAEDGLAHASAGAGAGVGFVDDDTIERTRPRWR